MRRLSSCSMPCCTSRSSPLFWVAVLISLSWSFGGNGLPWIVSSEIFPSRLRSLTGAFSAMAQWLASYVSTEAFPHMVASQMGVWGTFLFFSCCCLATLYASLPPVCKCIVLTEVVFLQHLHLHLDTRDESHPDRMYGSPLLRSSPTRSMETEESLPALWFPTDTGEFDRA